MYIDNVNATDDPASVGPVDLVLMCVKLHQLDDAMEVASPLVGPNTTVMGFQNGVTAEDRLIQRFGTERVLGVGASAGLVHFLSVSCHVVIVPEPLSLSWC
jgi:2-dehydropantoate 2-reductase